MSIPTDKNIAVNMTPTKNNIMHLGIKYDNWQVRDRPASSIGTLAPTKQATFNAMRVCRFEYLKFEYFDLLFEIKIS